MSDPMTLDRFQNLADAYGGVILRWPEQWRDAAMRMSSQPAASIILARAIALDEYLDAWTLPSVPAASHERVLSGAPVAWQSHAGRARLWWSGIGFAAALAGAAAGTVAVAVISPVDASPGSSTSFGDVGAPEG